ncbi:MAG TPA: hypothetical protein DCQ64_26530, partial [Candidatus Rokubacteria bacterium]|nr:hypothetical protein [Candidatus Rokubacteria bacterium]
MTAIPYLDEVWNVTTGCGDDIVSPGCQNCYARRMFGRHLWECPRCDGRRTIETENWAGAMVSRDCPTCHGTGKATFAPTFHPERLDQPLHWRKPRRIGVSFLGDLFHEGITDEQRLRVFAAMADAQQHTYVVLTKRPVAMRYFFSKNRIRSALGGPWPNVWLGVTVCGPDELWKVDVLRDTPAAVRWLSLEPMLDHVCNPNYDFHLTGIDWVVLGGETGPGARPMQPQWALDVYRQCKAAGVPFWFKDMGTAPGVERWDWPGAPGSDMLAEMLATHELPAVTP